MGLPLPDAGVTAGLKTSALNLREFVTHVFPRNFFEAMANNEILQILVFSVFFGLALGQLATPRPARWSSPSRKWCR